MCPVLERVGPVSQQLCSIFLQKHIKKDMEEIEPVIILAEGKCLSSLLRCGS